jgi:hypothetical protein
MVDLNERAKMMRIASNSIHSKYKDKLSDKEMVCILAQLLKSLIKYRAHEV